MSPKAILMMLKAMGINIDVEKVDAIVQDFMKNAPAYFQQVKTKAEEFEARLKRIEELLVNAAEGKQGDAIVDQKPVTFLEELNRRING